MGQAPGSTTAGGRASQDNLSTSLQPRDSNPTGGGVQRLKSRQGRARTISLDFRSARDGPQETVFVTDAGARQARRIPFGKLSPATAANACLEFHPSIPEVCVVRFLDLGPVFGTFSP